MKTLSTSIRKFLRRRHDLDLWLVTRVNGDEWIVLLADDPRGRVVTGQILPRSGSICRQMLEGMRRDPIQAATAGPDSSESPIVCQAVGPAVDQAVDQAGIGACIGAPLRSADGTVLGSLSGIHHAPYPNLDPAEHELVAVLADLLAGFMSAEIGSIELERQNERFRFEAMTDALTHLPNRRAWEHKLEREQSRALRLGETSFVSVIDLDELKAVNDAQGHAAGDELLRQTALALRYAVRDSDFIARLGGDEFAVLGIQSGTVDEADVDQRIQSALDRRGIRASVGTASGGPASKHVELWRRADAEMYRSKRRRELRDEYSG
jgi:diguanylate cyclase (GGDEF)-like protein